MLTAKKEGKGKKKKREKKTKARHRAVLQHRKLSWEHEKGKRLGRATPLSRTIPWLLGRHHV